MGRKAIQTQRNEVSTIRSKNTRSYLPKKENVYNNTSSFREATVTLLSTLVMSTVTASMLCLPLAAAAAAAVAAAAVVTVALQTNVVAFVTPVATAEISSGCGSDDANMRPA